MQRCLLLMLLLFATCLPVPIVARDLAVSSNDKTPLGTLTHYITLRLTNADFGRVLETYNVAR